MGSTDEYIINLKWSYELSSNCNPINSSFAYLVRERPKCTFSIVCELGKKEYHYQKTGIIFKRKQKLEKECISWYRENLPILNEFCKIWNCNYELFEESDPNGKWSNGSQRYYIVYAKMVVCDAMSVIKNEEHIIKNKHFNDKENLVNKIDPNIFGKFDQSLVNEIAESLFKYLNVYHNSRYSIIVTEKSFKDAYYEYDGDFSYCITQELDYKDVDAFFVAVMNQFSRFVAQSEDIISFDWYPSDKKNKYLGFEYNIFEIEIDRK